MSGIVKEITTWHVCHTISQSFQNMFGSACRNIHMHNVSSGVVQWLCLNAKYFKRVDHTVIEGGGKAERDSSCVRWSQVGNTQHSSPAQRRQKTCLQLLDHTYLVQATFILYWQPQTRKKGGEIAPQGHIPTTLPVCHQNSQEDGPKEEETD